MGIDQVNDALAKLQPVFGPLPQPKCVRCDGAVVVRFGSECSECTAQRARAERKDSLRRAWATVPQTLAWVAFDAPAFAEWVPDSDAARRAREALTAPMVTLTGPMRSGKTTLGCAMLREHIRRGARAGAAPRDVYHAQRARFARSFDLVREREATRLGDEHMPLWDVCLRASVLLLDELGEQHDRHGTIYALLHDRHAQGRQTIVTTWLTREQCA